MSLIKRPSKECPQTKREGLIIGASRAKTVVAPGQEVMTHQHESGHVCVETSGSMGLDQLIQALKKIEQMYDVAIRSFEEQLVDLEADLQFPEQRSRGSGVRYRDTDAIEYRHGYAQEFEE